MTFEWPTASGMLIPWLVARPLPRTPLPRGLVALAPLAATLFLAPTARAADASPASASPASEGPTVREAAPIAPPTTKEPVAPAASGQGKTSYGAPASADPASTHEGHFEFGSYGRVWAASDLRGRMGRGSNVVAFGPRLVDEGSYAELELRREDKWSDKVRGRVVSTLALFPPFFHFSGNPANSIGVRNLYAQGTYDKVTMWAGSRMYRGDDIYLLNWWPLDNQNTVGGGAFGSFDSKMGTTFLAAHLGQQRLDNPYQAQQVPVVAPYGFGAVNITRLDRPRTVATLKLTQFLRNGPEAHFFDDDKAGFKVSFYGEGHQISSGVLQDPLTKKDRDLPSDGGFLVGSQLTYYTGHHDTHAHLFLRHARGIAAYDPLEAPTTFALDRSTQGASDTRIAFSGNLESGAFAVAWGAYVRFFRDASTEATTTQKYDEGAVVARPSVFLGEHFGVSVEGSYQQRRLQIVSPGEDAPLTASVARFGVMPYFSPSGRGTFKRPQIRLLYSVTARDAGARALYATEDVVGQRSTDHFLGLGAEWWFNSSSYP